jgi:hypothetical protein
VISQIHFSPRRSQHAVAAADATFQAEGRKHGPLFQAQANFEIAAFSPNARNQMPIPISR